MRRYDNFCVADKGKQFILTEKGKNECASYAYKTVGQPVDDYNEVPYWAIESEYVSEVDIPGWTTLRGYEVVYYNKGYRLHAGNPQQFPTRELAETYKAHYESYLWNENEYFIEECEYEGVPLEPITTYYEGKPVQDMKHYHGLDAHKVGELFTDEVVEWFRDCVPPAYNSSTLIQCGEPSNHIGGRATYATFVRLAENVWEYKGDCHRGEREVA